MTFPTSANPSSESPRESRSTAALSTRSVSTRAPAPNRRRIDAASLAGGAACAVAAREGSAARSPSELVAEAEAQHLGFADTGLVAQHLVVALEHGVISRLVGQADGRDPP